MGPMQEQRAHDYEREDDTHPMNSQQWVIQLPIHGTRVTNRTRDTRVPQRSLDFVEAKSPSPSIKYNTLGWT